MAMNISLPGDYLNQRPDRVLYVGELTAARHHSRQASTNNRVQIAVPMIMVLTGGRKTVRWPGHRLMVGDGDIVFLAPGTYQMSENGSDCQALLVFFEPEFVARFCLRHPDVARAHSELARRDHAFTLRSTSFLKASIRSLDVFFGASTVRPTRLVEHKIEEIVLSALDADARMWPALRAVTRRDRSLVRYVELSRSGPHRLTDLARESGYSLSTFKRRFQAATGVPPAAWLRAKRLERAKILLETTDRSVTDIALEAGFASLSHFIQMFRRRYRMTPSRLRLNQNRQRVNRSRKT